MSIMKDIRSLDYGSLRASGLGIQEILHDPTYRVGVLCTCMLPSSWPKPIHPDPRKPKA